MEKRGGRPYGIADVARLAGVSVPTVSRVLGGSTPVSEARRNAVFAAMQQLNYRPNAAARALVSGSRSMIAILTAQVNDPAWADTIQGIIDAARASGYSTVITILPSEDEAELDEAIGRVLSQPVAGAIVLAYDAPGFAALEQFPSAVPLVCAGPVPVEPPKVPVAAIDARSAARTVTQSLLDLGHQTVHFIGHVPQSGLSRRLLGWRETLVEAVVPIPTPLIGAASARSGYQLVERLIEDPMVTAVLCENDEIAFGAMRRLREQGWQIPTDVSVVGFGGGETGLSWHPPLSTVVLDFTETGRRATMQLLDLIAEGSCDPVSITVPEVAMRMSTAEPPSVPVGCRG